MNIPDEIYEYAKKHGIDWTPTGGGCDFIIRTIGRTELKLADPEDTGWCPDSIDDECVVCIFDTELNWNGETAKMFPNCRDAIDWMAKCGDLVADANSLLDSLIKEYEDRMENRERDGEEVDNVDWKLLCGIIHDKEKSEPRYL